VNDAKEQNKKWAIGEIANEKLKLKDAERMVNMRRQRIKTLEAILKAAVLLLALAFPAFAQTHQAVLSWTDTLNPTGTTYTILRSPGMCSGTPSFSIIASGVTAMTYTDTTVTPGNYCYEVEATSGGVLSAPSNTALAPIPAFAPTGLAVTVQ
jgi:hypothetical protein